MGQGRTFDDVRGILGTGLSHISNHLDQVLDDSKYAAINDGSLPSSFDATTQWAGLVHPIRNQEQCGSCWAVSASEVLSDRFAIATAAMVAAWLALGTTLRTLASLRTRAFHMKREVEMRLVARTSARIQRIGTSPNSKQARPMPSMA